MSSLLEFAAGFGVLALEVAVAVLLVVLLAALIDWAAVRTGHRSPLQRPLP